MGYNKSNRPSYGKSNCIFCGTEFEKRTKNHNRCDDCADKTKKEIRETYFYVFNRDEFRCVYCGKSSIEDGVKLEVDHIYPISVSKNNDVINLVTSCKVR